MHKCSECPLIELELGATGNCAINQWEMSPVDRESIHNSFVYEMQYVLPCMSVINKTNLQIYLKKKLDALSIYNQMK